MSSAVVLYMLFVLRKSFSIYIFRDSNMSAGTMIYLRLQKRTTLQHPG